MKDLEEYLRKKYVKKPEENENIYNKAISARAYDILRGFLPAGVTTQLSWHTNLRQAHDKLSLLHHHPLGEIRKIAGKINSTLRIKYAHSFGHKLYKDTENFREEMARVYTYYHSKKYSGDFIASTNISNKELESYKNAITNRPSKTSLPIFLSELGSVTFDFLLDFGSFRDIQRHRNGVCRMPLLNTKYGFNQWYVDQLPLKLKRKAKVLISKQKKAIDKIKARPEDLQYLIAMGFNVSARTTYGLPAAVYTMELRSGSLVHPTLRKVTHKMHKFLRKKFPKLKLYTDMGLDDWDIKRGAQDIKEKTHER